MNTGPQFHSSTDATRGQYIGGRVLARKEELETALASCDPSDTTLRETLEFALASVEPLLTGDLAHPSAVVAYDLNLWLERNKYLAQAASEPEFVGRAHGSMEFDDAFDTRNPDVEERAVSDDIVTPLHADGGAQDHTLED